MVVLRMCRLNYIFLVFIFCNIVTVVRAADFYVSTTGNDNINDGTFRAPLKTIQKAYELTSQNNEPDTIHLRRGDIYTCTLNKGRKIRSVKLDMAPKPDKITFCAWGDDRLPRPIWRAEKNKSDCLRVGRLVFHVRDIEFHGKYGIDAQMPGCTVDNSVFKCSMSGVNATATNAAHFRCSNSILNNQSIDWIPDKGMAYKLNVDANGWYRVRVENAEPVVDGWFGSKPRYRYFLKWSNGEGFWHDENFSIYLSKGENSVLAGSDQQKDFLDFSLTKIDELPEQTAWMFLKNKSRFLRIGESIKLRIRLAAGEYDKVEIVAVDHASNEELFRNTVKPTGYPVAEDECSIVTNKAGQWDFKVFVDGNETKAKPIKVVVIDTAVLAKPNNYKPLSDDAGSLIADIDCTKILKNDRSYVDSGDSEIVSSLAGHYREAGDGGKGRLQGPGSNSYFGYKIRVENPGKLHRITIEYPDDKYRVFLAHIAEKEKSYYAWGSGICAGGPNPVSNKMQEREIYIWPRGEYVWLMLHTWLKAAPAAASRIRVYEFDGELPPLPVKDEDRYYGIYMEEPRAMEWGYVPDGNPKTIDDSLKHMFTWMRHVGQNLLWYPVAAYNTTTIESPLLDTLYWRDDGLEAPYSFRGMLLEAERYGVDVIAELHWALPCVDRAIPTTVSPWDLRQVARDGHIGNFEPFGGAGYNWLHPEVREAILAAYREMFEFYKDCPSLMGVAIRTYGWGFNVNFAWPNLEWGYGDYTVALFEKETGIDVPVDDNKDDLKRFQKRYDYLTTNMRREWLDWRREKVSQWVQDWAETIHSVRADCKLVLPVRQEPEPERGLYPEDLAKIPNVVTPLYSIYNKQYSNYHFPADRAGYLKPFEKAKLRFDESRLKGAVQNVHPYMEAFELDIWYPEWLKKQITGARLSCGAPEASGLYPSERFADFVSCSPPWLFADGALTHQATIAEHRQKYAKFIRSLPNIPLESLEVNLEPVFMLKGKRNENEILVLTNRQDYPVTVTINFSDENGFLRKLDTDVLFAISNSRMNLELAPFDMTAFELANQIEYSSAKVNAPGIQIKALKRQIDEAVLIVDRCDKGVEDVASFNGRRLRDKERPCEILHTAKSELQKAKLAFEQKKYDTAERYIRGYDSDENPCDKSGYALPIVYEYMNKWPYGIWYK